MAWWEDKGVAGSKQAYNTHGGCLSQLLLFMLMMSYWLQLLLLPSLHSRCTVSRCINVSYLPVFVVFLAEWCCFRQKLGF
jgi:hypothetical protein